MRQRRLWVVLCTLILSLWAVNTAMAQSIEWTPPGFALDGNLGEWRRANRVGEGSGLGDGALVYAARDRDSLYLAIEVRDKKVILDELSSDFSGGDYVRVGWDMLGDAANRRHALPAADDYVFAVSPPTKFGQALVALGGYGGHEQLSFDLRQIDVKAVRHPEGYAIEARFPAKSLGVTLVPGQRIGLNVLVKNTDGSGADNVLSLDGTNDGVSPMKWAVLTVGK